MAVAKQPASRSTVLAVWLRPLVDYLERTGFGSRELFARSGVDAGQVLAMVEPPLPVTEVVQLSANRAQVQSLETELALRELDLDTRALEVERSLIQSEARRDYAFTPTEPFITG